jgi:L-ascorbate metabolism protein UlaG (beta-lactamase superfamily)
MKYTYLGHSCFQLEINGITVIVDPFIRYNPKASHIDVSALRADFILISHGHQDHVADAMEIAKNSNATVISNFEIASWFEKQGVEKTIGMNTGGKVQTAFGTVKLTAAVHSSVLPDGSYAGNPNGFLIQTESKSIYYAGDTALTLDMQLIPLWAPALDVAILPIGDHFTMGIEDAVHAATFVKAKKVLPVHYDSFPPIAVNHEEAIHQFKAKDIELVFTEIGKDRTL